MKELIFASETEAIQYLSDFITMSSVAKSGYGNDESVKAYN
jgi:hypothetical protein